jgi:hypothetical protein
MKKSIKIIFALSIAAFIYSCSGSETKVTVKNDSKYQKLDIPKGYELLGQSDGDLDKDGEDERVYVYNTDSVGEYGTTRVIYICKKEKDEWMLWKTMRGPVMASEAGGMMGDPFDNILINKGQIYITHYGASSVKWYYNLTYKIVGRDFKLVEVVVDFGRPCAKWETYIYKLKTGDLSYDLAPEDCEESLLEEYVIAAHEDYKIKKSRLPLMDGFEPGNNELLLPDDSGAVYY